MVNASHACLVFYIFRLRTMIESARKILKLDWKTPGLFFFKRVRTFCVCGCVNCRYFGQTDHLGVTNESLRPSQPAAVSGMRNKCPKYSAALWLRSTGSFHLCIRKLIPAYGCIDFSCCFRRAQNLGRLA